MECDFSNLCFPTVSQIKLFLSIKLKSAINLRNVARRYFKFSKVRTLDHGGLYNVVRHD